MSTQAPDPLARQLRTFADHIRDPERAPAPAGVPDRRMEVYRDLFFNNLRGMLADTYPVCHAILGEERWTRLIRAWFREHRPTTPLFPELPRELLAWLERPERPALADEPPFLAELAHYEWLEIEVAHADETAPVVEPGDLLEGAPVTAAAVRWARYTWPVPHLGPDYQPDTPPAEPTGVIVHRDDRGRVGFVAATPATLALLDGLAAAPGVPGRTLLTELARTLGHADPAPVIAAGADILADLRERGIIAGIAPANANQGEEESP
ncbi:MAG: DNA-binding domain-containing protein [Pseudomonadota bacterium]